MHAPKIRRGRWPPDSMPTSPSRSTRSCWCAPSAISPRTRRNPASVSICTHPTSRSVLMSLTTTAAPDPWYRTITREQWRALAAAKIGWMLDAMDFMLYAVALNQLRLYFGFDDATAGLLTTAALVMSGVGGLTFGYIGDRFGRTRALMGTIAIFSIASLGAATSQTVIQLLLWRMLLGLGMGGEWASGAVLVSETWPAQHRNKR